MVSPTALLEVCPANISPTDFASPEPAATAEGLESAQKAQVIRSQR